MNRIIRHLLLAGASTALVIIIYLLLDSPSSIFLLSMATAYTGLILIAVTLVIGPLNLIRHTANPVSTYLRRDIGIWAAIVTIIHVIIGLQRHMDGKFWLYFLHDSEAGFRIRYDAFGFANHTGLISTIICLLLLILSNNASIKKLGAAKWKKIQQYNYLSFLLIVAHSFLYQAIVNRSLSFVMVVGVIFVLVLGMQWKGFRLHSSG